MKEQIVTIFLIMLSALSFGQTLSEKQQLNARATGYGIVAAKNPGKSFSIYVIPWDGINSLEYNANNQINSGWHAQAAVKGNYFSQSFDGSDFSRYSSVVLSEEEFNAYKSLGTQWWIICSDLSPFSNTSIRTLENGNILVGKTVQTNSGYKLDINGKIRANEIVVNTSGADFVFEENYKLKSLSEVEAFVKEHKHLPGVNSANEMQKEGVALSEFQTTLLQKIEELTLHLIEQNKRLKKQEKQIRELSAFRRKN
ncbi:hypothetical protein [Pedobacter nutrimenti]|uniref:Uncharacterized protein n=1 Tax=Pedobacter nutrimenti TaxID=1241337 RepID=A0A318URI7_9SPHI|nr:hypothetical protein [Pedobacter nutrimenti]PYF74189.1 hypothetical protein B0O44_104360 [Pedobacter nutrimenti]